MEATKQAFIKLVYEPFVLEQLLLNVEDIPFYDKWNFDLSQHGDFGFHVSFKINTDSVVNIWLKKEENDMYLLTLCRDFVVVEPPACFDKFDIYVQPDFLERCGFLLGGDEN